MKKVSVIVLLSAVSMAVPQLVSGQNPAPAPVTPPAPQPTQSTQPARPAPPAPAAPVTRAPQPGRVAAVPAPTAPPEPRRVPRNVKFEITVTDTAGAKPVTKTLAVTVSDVGGNGSIRSTGILPNGGQIPLNVDVRNVVWDSESLVRASVNVEYQAYIPDAKPQPGMVVAVANSLFQDGRRTQILQAADPTSDRRTTIDVTATILK